MRTIRTFLRWLARWIFANWSSSPSTTQTSAAPGADGTLVVREKGVLRIANGGSGQGTLTFRGWEYPFEINNMALSGIGPGHIQLEGDVFNLNDTGDFAGTYKILAAEVEAGEGAQGFWFENENGVRVHIRTEGQDVTIGEGKEALVDSEEKASSES